MGFFDRMKDSVSLAGTGASQKVSCTADTMKLKNAIRANEQKIERLTFEVGVQCVKEHLLETNSEYEELFAQIRLYQAENKAHMEEIERLAKTYEEDREKRQQKMRALQEEREQQHLQKEEMQRKADEATKICKKCKMGNELDACFCVYCGNPLEEEETETIHQEGMTETKEERADVL